MKEAEFGSDGSVDCPLSFASASHNIDSADLELLIFPFSLLVSSHKLSPTKSPRFSQGYVGVPSAFLNDDRRSAASIALALFLSSLTHSKLSVIGMIL